MEQRNLIYWERQEVDMLCAVHAMNSLLQYPYWDAVSLAEIARSIDEAERSIISNHKSSHNVEESGFFSIQAITKALELKDLTINYFNPKNDPTVQQGFICNFHTHWFSVRKINGEWFNLNSIAEGPKFIGEIYLSEMFFEIQRQGYTIFVVSGEFPENPPYIDLTNQQMLFTVDQVKYGGSKNKMSKEDEELARVLAISAGDEMQEAVKMSLEAEEEFLLKQAIEMSKDVVGEAETNIESFMEYCGEGTFGVRLKCLNGKTVIKVFVGSCRLEEVLRWAKAENKYGNIRLVQAFPRKIFNEPDRTLDELGINASNCSIIAEKTE